MEKTKILKSELLPAMQTILQEYKDKTHKAQNSTCSLCKLYVHNKCCSCPMKVFNDYENNFPCINRLCRPMSCYPFTDNDNSNLLAVIAFYEKAIAKVEKMTEEELNKENAFNFLIKIDEKVAKKYEIL
jgi:hypothetical protein